jgi:peptidylprolyl isomerase
MLVVLALAAAAVSYLIVNRNASSGTEVTTASGLKYVDLTPGTGATPQTGQMLTVHYTGTLQNGKKFDSSVDRGKPYQFRIGTGTVIKGWDEGLMGMKVGGKRKLIVPPALGYGPTGTSNIPPNSILLFDVELLDVK